MRLEWMDTQSIDSQVVGGWLDSFGNELPPAEGEAWSQFLNEYLVTGTKDLDRLHPLATVPPQDGVCVAKALEDAMAAGAYGVMTAAQPNDQAGNLDDPDLDPF